MKRGDFNSNEGVSLNLILILLVPVLIIGFFAGSPILSAKLIVDSELNKIAYLTIAVVLFIIGILFTRSLAKVPVH